jgi:coproporphyrinogen III oxidase-like Fe-S oxidoreductase
MKGQQEQAESGNDRAVPNPFRGEPIQSLAAVQHDLQQAQTQHEIDDAEIIDLSTSRLALSAGFSLGDFQRRFGQSFDDRFGGVAQRLIADGLLLRNDDRIRLSDRGLELADAVFAEFL